MKSFRDNENIVRERTISQMLNVGPNFYFFEKKGNVYSILKTFFPKFSKTKYKTYK